MLTGAYKTKRMASALTFIERYHKAGDEFLSHIVRVTIDETWVSFMNIEIKEQSKHCGCTHIHQTSRKKYKQTLCACQKGYSNCSDTGEEC
jgi:hypothetical protein